MMVDNNRGNGVGEVVCNRVSDQSQAKLRQMSFGGPAFPTFLRCPASLVD